LLNQAQQAAVTYLQGPLLVLAGAGCGKTRVITEKIAYLIDRQGMNPAHITAITFTNKAAREMTQRAGKRVRLPADQRPNISTFHSLGLRIIREELANLPYRHGFSIFDAAETRQVLQDLLPAGFGKEQLNQLQWQISAWKNAGLEPENVHTPNPLHVEVYRQYRQQLLDYNALDFDDLILQPLKLFRDNSDALLRWQARMRYVLVDEYQDTNASQYQLLKLLTGMHRMLMAVGDDDQSIYGWRGAQPENLSLLKKDFPELQVIKLEQNYRSTGTILQAANAVIRNNPHAFEKKLWSTLGEGQPIIIRRYDTPEQEAEKIAEEMLRRVMLKKNRWGDFAVLYRSNHQARVMEQALRVKNIPYQISGGRSFFDFSEIRDLMAYVRLLCNPSDNSAFLRVVNVPRRGIGASTLSRLAQLAEKQHMSLLKACQKPEITGMLPPRPAATLQHFADMITRYRAKLAHEDGARLIAALIRETDYRSWLLQSARDAAGKKRKAQLVEDFLEWMQTISQSCGGQLMEMAAQITLLGAREKDDSGADAVRLMTLHAAKGLEFHRVYMIGVEEGILPHRSALEENSVDEERRLMYVGMTRAERELVISWVKKRRQRFSPDAITKSGPSRFLGELPEALCQGLTTSGKKRQTPGYGGEQLARIRAELGLVDKKSP